MNDVFTADVSSDTDNATPTKTRKKRASKPLNAVGHDHFLGGMGGMGGMDMNKQLKSNDIYPEKILPPTENQGGMGGMNEAEAEGILSKTTKKSPFPPSDKRPCFVCLSKEESGDRQSGVWYCHTSPATDTKPAQDVEDWVCSELVIDSMSRDKSGDTSYGRVLRFLPTGQKKWRVWAMPMALLAGDCVELRRILLDMGVLLSPTKKSLLPRYLQSKTPPKQVICAEQTGWLDGRFRAFVLPNEIIGPEADRAIFQTEGSPPTGLTVAGTLEGWRSTIGAWCIGNPVLMVSVSCAFVGPLLGRIGRDGFGIHLEGASSRGKSASQLAAVSAWGAPEFKRSWKTTLNGLEALCQMSNETFLALDELKECDPKDVGAMLYALANGVGKTRASRSGLARPTARWRTVALSSGELKTASAMALAGQLIHAGQEVRMLNVPVTNQQHGAWDNLHSHASGSSFTIALKAAAAQNYGHPARQYIEQMTHDKGMTDDGIAELLDGIKATIGASLPPDCDGQITRALEQFALVAMAGELATNYGITGWPEGDATAAASWAFTEWLKARTAGTANAEDQQAEDAIRAFIDRHGSSRFGSSKTPTAMTGHEMPEKIVNQCGWWRDQQDKDGITHREWLFSPTGMKEALHGLDFTRAIEVLVQRGFIAPDKDGKRQVKAWIQGRSIRVYVVRFSVEG